MTTGYLSSDKFADGQKREAGAHDRASNGYGIKFGRQTDAWALLNLGAKVH